MRKIKLELVVEFGSRADFAIIDLTEEPVRKRGTITIDYTPSDVREHINAGLDLSGALDYYRNRIYQLVKYYIAGDWEDAGGLEEAMEIIEKHVRIHYE